MDGRFVNRALKLPVVSQTADYQNCVHSRLWERAAAEICAKHRINYRVLCRSTDSENIVFFVDKDFVIKIFAPFRNMYSREASALRFAHGNTGIKTPELFYAGEIEGWSYLIIEQLDGRSLEHSWSALDRRKQRKILSALGAAMKQLHSWKGTFPEAATDNDLAWPAFLERQARSSVERQRVRGASTRWLDCLPRYISSSLRLFPAEQRSVLLHGDLHPGNLLLDRKHAHWDIVALVDFADSLRGFCEYDFVKPVMHMAFGERNLQRALLLAYGYKQRDLDVRLRRRLMLLTILHEGSNLLRAAIRFGPNAKRWTLEELEAKIWPFV